MSKRTASGRLTHHRHQHLRTDEPKDGIRAPRSSPPRLLVTLGVSRETCGCSVGDSDGGEDSDQTVQTGRRSLGSAAGGGHVYPSELQPVEQVVVPSILVRRLADHDTTTRANQTSGRRECELGRSESTRDHCIECLVWSKCRDILAHHGNAMLPAQSTHHPLQEVRSLGTTIEQGDAGCRSVVSDHQTWNTATGTEVENRRGRAETVETFKTADESASMLDHFGNRTRSQEPESLCIFEYVDECGIDRHAHGDPTGSARIDDDATVGVLANRAARHAVLVIEDIVDHLAVR